MSNPTPTTLREILEDAVHIGYANGYNQLASMARVAPYNHIEPITLDQATQSIKEQLKALLPAKSKGAKVGMFETGAEIDAYTEGKNEIIDLMNKAIEEWAK